MKVPICDGFYEHSSRNVNFQRCLNLFPSVAGPNARSPEGLALVYTPGLLEIADAAELEVRALIPFDNQLFAAIDNKFYEVEVDFGSETAILSEVGTLLAGSGRITWARNSTQIFINEGDDGASIYTVDDNTLTEITDVDFQFASTVTFLHGYFIYNIPDTGQMASTAINDGSDINALDIATAEGSPDKLVAVLSDKSELWALGESSTEIWYDAANATGFPFSRREGAYLDIGCGAKYSAISINNTLMWLDHRRYVVMVQGYNVNIISTPAISAEFTTYDDVSDAFAYEHFDRGHLFYVISFPTAGKTWAYDLTTEKWHERSHWNEALGEHEEHLINAKATFQGHEVVGDRTNGKIYIYSSDYLDDNGTVIHRIRTTPQLNNEFKFIGMDALELYMEAGTAPSSGDGSDPFIALRYSNDGGHTWSNSLYTSTGNTGEYNTAVRWNRLGTARSWIFEFTFAYPAPFILSDATADVSLELI